MDPNLPEHPSTTLWKLAAAGALAALLAAQAAQACDGKAYSLPITPGAIVEGGGVTVRLDKIKFLDDVPDKYFISVKDDGAVLADHAVLLQYDTLNFKTRCGTLSIGADRKFSFGNKSLTMNWSYF